MYRLLIVDDEEIIVNGLSEIFKTVLPQELDVYKANSAQEAIDWLTRTRIDVVLSDIMMPEMDGLGLLEEIHKRWPFCHVIFLTGHDNFDYIYHALQIKNVGYLLKTEDPDYVIQAVMEAIESIKKNHELEDFIHDAKEQINMAKTLFQKDILSQALMGNPKGIVDDTTIEAFNIPLDVNKSILLVMVMHRHIANDVPYAAYMEQLYAIKRQLEQHIWMKVRYSIIMNDNHDFIIFVQQKPEDDMPILQVIHYLKGTFELLQSVIQEQFGVNLNCLIGHEAYAWEKLNEGYQKLERIKHGLDLQKMDMVMTDSELEQYMMTDGLCHSNDLSLGYKLERNYITTTLDFAWVKTGLMTGDFDGYFKQMDLVVKPIRVISSMHHTGALEIYYQCALSILNVINQRDIMRQLAFKIGQNRLMRIDLHQSWHEAVDYLYAVSHAIFELQKEVHSNREDAIIRKLHTYIHQHLDEELSLVKLSEQVFLNPSYLSRFYKQRTGNNLSDFIDQTRIQRVIEMMKTRPVKIHLLGEAIGYDNPGSFTRFFKKMTHLAPQEYFESLHLR